MTVDASFVFVVPALEALPTLLTAVFEDGWVASYQVGFGPPLIRATPELAAEVATTRSALEKLEVYLRRCLFDDLERERLARKQRESAVRRGPVEVESLNRASELVWDLSLRLHTPSSAPLGIASRMKACGVSSLELPPSTPPEALTGRFRLHLHDPRGARLLDVPVVAAAAAAAPEPAGAAALELRVPLGLRWVWQRWLVDLEGRRPEIAVVDLGEPTSHARVRRDGTSR